MSQQIFGGVHPAHDRYGGAELWRGGRRCLQDGRVHRPKQEDRHPGRVHPAPGINDISNMLLPPPSTPHDQQPAAAWPEWGLRRRDPRSRGGRAPPANSFPFDPAPPPPPCRPTLKRRRWSALTPSPALRARPGRRPCRATRRRAQHAGEEERGERRGGEKRRREKRRREEEEREEEARKPGGASVAHHAWAHHHPVVAHGGVTAPRRHREEQDTRRGSTSSQLAHREHVTCHMCSALLLVIGQEYASVHVRYL